VAVAKVTLPISVMLYRGILCNILVCLAVLLSIIATDTTGKILAIIFPVSAFVALGFEHCVANTFILPLALMYHASFSVGAMLINLGMVTLGNVLGGCLFVALPYFLIYGDRTGDNPYHRLD
jgi:formate/nitrite transporter FocA (FNT family)